MDSEATSGCLWRLGRVCAVINQPEPSGGCTQRCPLAPLAAASTGDIGEVGWGSSVGRSPTTTPTPKLDYVLERQGFDNLQSSMRSL